MNSARSSVLKSHWGKFDFGMEGTENEFKFRPNIDKSQTMVPGTGKVSQFFKKRPMRKRNIIQELSSEEEVK